MADPVQLERPGASGTVEQRLLDQVPAAVVATDPAGVVTHWNREAEALFGWTRQEATGRSVEQVMLVSGLETGPDILLAPLRGGRPWRGEILAGRKDGTTFPAFVTLSGLSEDAGSAAGAVVVSVDITERKRGERRLAAQYAVARILAESATLEDAAPRILREVCEVLGWEVGLMWTIDPPTSSLRMVEAWHDPAADVESFVERSRDIAFEPGAGLPGRVWESKTALWLPDFATHGTLPRAPVARAVGLHGAFGFPVVLRGHVLGVVEFLSGRVEAPDEDLLQMTSAIGSQVGQFMERTEAQAALRASEARKAAMATASLDAVVVMDGDGVIREFNPAAEATFGYRRRDAVGSLMVDMLVPPHLRDRQRADLARYLETGRSSILGRRIELEGMRADGSTFPAELSITRTDVDGRPGFTAFIRDITERAAAEEQLREAEQRYRSLVETTPVVSYTDTLDVPSRCLYISPQIEALTGYTPEEWKADPHLWERMLHPDDREREVAKDLEADRSQQPYRSEYRLLARDGREIWVRDEAVVTKSEGGGPPLWQGVMADITERKQREFQLRARARQQETVADLGRMALTDLDVPLLMDRAVTMVTRTLELGHCVLFQLLEGGRAVIRSGKGWRDGVVGSEVDAGPNSLLGYTEATDGPVVMRDLPLETRFSAAGMLLEHQLVSGISVLIRGQERQWGVLAAFSTEARVFPDDDVFFLRAVANVLAMALERRREEERRAALLTSEQAARAEAERARERLRFLAEASTVLSSSLDYEATLSRLATLAVPEMADWCVVYRLTETGDMVRLALAHDDPDGAPVVQELQQGVRLNPDADVGVPKVLRTGLPVLYAEADAELVSSDSADPETALRLTSPLGIVSWMCVPLNARGRTIGAISFFNARSGRRFGREDLDLAMELARHAALAVDNAHLYEAELDARRATERAAQRTALLQAVTAALSEALGPEEVAEIVVDRCVAAMGAAAGLVARVVPEVGELQVLRSLGYRQEVSESWRRWPLELRTPLSDAVRTAEPVFVRSRQELDAAYPDLPKAPAENEALSAVPLVVEGRAVGGMALSFHHPREFTPEDRSFLMALARQCAQALERSRLYQAELTARAEAERANDRLAFLAEASEILSKSLDYRKTLSELTSLTVPRLADWCSVDLMDDGTITLVAVAHVDPSKVQLARDLRRRFPPDPDAPTGVPNVIRTGQPEMWPEIPDDLIDAVEDPEIRQLVRDLQFRSVMIVPLKSRGRVLGAITFVWAESGRAYGPADLALAQDLARRVAQSVENALVYRERDHIAKTLQQSLLPPDLPDIPGIELAARYLPAGAGNEVGGDFYDVFDTGDGAWGLALGDVCGKGPDAAAIMGLARYTLRAAAMRERRPSRILETMNEAVMQQTVDGRFLTVAYTRIRPGANFVRLTVSCGGHPLPRVLRSSGAMETAGKPGTLLGLFPDPELSDDTVDLGPGDAMVVYTDGVTDSPGFEEGTGERRLSEVLAGCAGISAAEIADRIEREVLSPRKGARRDDVAFVILRVQP